MGLPSISDTLFTTGRRLPQIISRRQREQRSYMGTSRPTVGLAGLGAIAILATNKHKIPTLPTPPSEANFLHTQGFVQQQPNNWHQDSSETTKKWLPGRSATCGKRVCATFGLVRVSCLHRAYRVSRGKQSGDIKHVKHSTSHSQAVAQEIKWLGGHRCCWRSSAQRFVLQLLSYFRFFLPH